MGLGPLQGFTIGITADRRGDEQAELFARRGAAVLRGPTISTDYLGPEGPLLDATRRVIASPPSFVVVTTGIGVRAWFEAAHAWGLGADLAGSLGEARIVARGPKAAAALAVAGLAVWANPPSERLDDCVAELLEQPLAGATVALQEHGEESGGAVAALERAGASVMAVPVYRWRPPGAPAPARKLLAAAAAGRLDAVTFTSAPALRNLVALAGEEGLAGDLLARFNRGKPLAACIGPVCAEHARAVGIESPLFPPVGRLGLLVRAVTDALHRRRVEMAWGGSAACLQGTALAVGDRVLRLTEREGAVLHVLARAEGAVVAKAALMQEVWGPGNADVHSVEVTVDRIRRRLGPEGPRIRAVRGRGYHLTA